MKRFLSILICITCCLSLSAQFYNGLQQDFGKNRIQYGEKFWFYFRHDNYDIYFDKNGRNLAEFVAKNVDSNYAEIKRFLEFDYSRRIVFVVYNTLSDFRQSNIGYSTSEEDYNIGGTTQIIDNKVILYFTGDHNDLLRQIKNGIAEVMLSEFFFGIGSYRRILSNSTLASYPTWFFDGILDYLSQDKKHLTNEVIIQKANKGDLQKMSQLYSDDAIEIGSAFWNFIDKKYGSKNIANILYLSKLTGDIDDSFQYVLGKDLQILLLEMEEFYRSTTKNEQISSNIDIPNKLCKRNITDIALNLDASKMLFVTNKKGKTNIWTYNFETSETEKIFRLGSVVEQINDLSYPVVQWHPTANALTYFYEKKGTVWFSIYRFDTKERFTKEFHHFEKVLDFSYSSDGNDIVFSGVKGGQTDIFTYNIQSFSYEQITNDIADDRNPSFIGNSHKILYTSNRANDNLNDVYCSIKKDYDIFIVNADSLQRLNNTANNEQKAIEFEQGKYLYLSNTDSAQNIFVVTTDSTIISIDTAFHYSYFTNNYTYTNHTKKIQNYSYANNTLVEQLHDKKRTIFVKTDFDQSHLQPTTITKTNTERNETRTLDTINTERETANLYKTNFYINQLVNQIDFSFINSGYQPFTGQAYDYTQNMNILLKLGIIDLFEDYRLTGAYRFTGSLGTNEYLLSVENLKDRIDRQYIYHRQSSLRYGTKSNYDYDRIQDNNFLCRFKYPFTQLQSISINPNIRYVRDITLSTDTKSLEDPTTEEFWAGISCNYIFDNVRRIDLNIYNGTRAKAFAEGFSRIDKSSYLCVFGFDIRHYQKIHRNIIIAGRVAYSSSFGNSPLLYYLGAVDNWLNWFGKYDTYNSEIQYDHTTDWAYQAIGTNMRGFSQNIRNGNSFAVANIELRVPIIQYFYVKPLKSDILKNFQVVGFVDIGGAWSGLLPGTKENAYNYTIINNEPIHVEIDEMRQPFVAGYGYGFRTQLFGYFVRLDLAWGNDEGQIQRMNHFSIGIDF